MKLITVLFLLFIIPAVSFAKDFSRKGAWEFGVWSGGGAALSEDQNDTNLWLSGLRFGKVLTANGKLEYVAELIPAFFVFQDSTVYGLDVTPFLLKWNFKTSGRAIPFLEFGAGMLFSSSDVPENTSSFNFTPQGGLGMHVFSGNNRAVTFTLKYMHISSGGLESPNPGMNSIQMHVGYTWFR